MKQSSWFRIVAGIVLSLMFGMAARAQNATLTGTVSDESGAMMPGVEITVSNTETGIKRTTTSDAQGRWNVPSLNPGTYEVSTTLTGFDTMVRQGITLTVGQVVNLPLTMKVGSVQEQVTVTGDAPLVDVSTSNVSGVVEERRIQELPLNGRDFSQLALVQPGAVSVRGSDQGASKGFGTRVALAGSRADQTGWQLDGTNINSVGNFGTPGSASGVMMGVDAVREFRVLSGGYSAEFGGYSGGMVQMITKSGTNDIHGTAYGYHRNDNVDAASWENNRGGRKKAEFRRNQFGASGGGPIIKDKAFVFGNYEGLRQANIGVADAFLVPGPDLRRGILPDGTTVAIAPTIQPVLNLYPLPNGGSRGNGLFEYFGDATRITNENFFVTRGDYNLNSNMNLFGRFQFDNGNDRIPQHLDISDTIIKTKQRYTTLQFENILSPTLLSSTRAAYNRTTIVPTVELKVEYPQSLYMFNADYPASFGFTGAEGLSLNSNDTTYRVQNLYEINQGFTLSKSAHTMKFGFGWSHVGFNTSGPAAGAFGDFAYPDARSFLTDTNLSQFQVEVPGSSTTRSTRQKIYSMYFQDDWRVKSNLTLNLGLRFEPWTAPDEKWGRVSTIRNWMEATRYDTPETGTDTFFESPGMSTWSPRVGFAWDVQGNGKTAVRGGFGVFHQLILGNYLNTITRKNPPYAATIVVSGAPATAINIANAQAYTASVGPSLLSPFLQPFPVVDALAEFIEYDAHSSYDMKFNLSVEHQLMNNLALSAQYVGSRGNHLFRLADGNAAIPTIVNGRPFVASGTPRPNTYLDQATVRNTDGKAFYNALLVELKKRFNRGFQFNAAYTFSRNVDDATTGLALTDYNEGANSQPYDTKSDRGLSSLHLKHNFVLNGLWQIPSFTDSGVANAVLGGWRLSSILTASSGAPFTVQIGGRNAPDQSRSAGRQRPELDSSRTSESITSGVSTGCSFGTGLGQTIAAGTKLGTPDLYYDPCAFSLPPAGFYGSLGRNTLIGPKYFVMDFSLQKAVPVGLGEGRALTFNADFFNLLNHPNFGRPANAVLNAGANPSTLPTAALRTNTLIGGAGQINNTVSTARQMQFGLKLIF
jgi:hypothetical protein